MKLERLPDGELDIMKELWREGRALKASEIAKLLAPKHSWKVPTVHVLLSRLEEKGFVTAYEREAAAGKPRRYYHLTEEGGAALKEKEASWNLYAHAVGRVLKGGVCCGEA